MTVYSGESLSLETSWLVQNELASLEHDFATGSILGVPAHCLIGVEIDFNIREKDTTHDQRAVLELSRASMAAELSLLVPKDQEQAERKAQWIQQIPKLSLAELVNYQVYRRLSTPTLDSPNKSMYLHADDSPETTLEFVFGNGLYQTGYYDNPASFEMRTQAAKPTIADRRIKRALAVAREVAEEFGAIFYYEGSHTNFSVWTSEDGELRPLHTLDSKDGQELARKGVAGMLYALRDSMSVLKPPRCASPPDRKVDQLLEVHPERDGTFRVVPDRFEQRISVSEKNHDLNALALMSGFAYGVNNETIDTSFITIDTGTLLTAGDGYNKIRDLYLLRALQQSLQPDGSFVFPGVSEFNENRGNGMISSLIGVGVYARGSASPIIKSLVEKIRLGEDGLLGVDEKAFNRAIDNASFHLTILGKPGDTVQERLSRIRVLPDSPLINGSLECEYPSGVKLHADLAEYSSRPSLGYIGAHVLKTVGREQAEAFTHEEAVFKYIDTILESSRMSAAEKIAQIQPALDRFPDADPAIVRQYIRQELESTVKRFATAARETPQTDARSIYRYNDRMDSLSRSLELHDIFRGASSPRSVEEFLREQESARLNVWTAIASICVRGIQKFRNLQKSD